jgi:hypothetical protein
MNIKWFPYLSCRLFHWTSHEILWVSSFVRQLVSLYTVSLDLLTDTWCSIFPSLSHRFPILLSSHWPCTIMSQNITTHVLCLMLWSPSYIYCVSVGSNARILKTPNYSNRREELRLEYDTWNDMPVWSQQCVKKMKRKASWINFFNIM